MHRCWSGSQTPIEWYQNKLLSSHLQAADVQNATNKVTFAKSTPSDAFYYTCTSNGLLKTFRKFWNPSIENPKDATEK